MDIEVLMTADMIAKIDWAVCYLHPEAHRCEMAKAWKNWWDFNHRKPFVKVEPKELWYARFLEFVAKRRRYNAISKNGRCPECGAKLSDKIVRCLACDLRDGVLA